MENASLRGSPAKAPPTSVIRAPPMALMRPKPLEAIRSNPPAKSLWYDFNRMKPVEISRVKHLSSEISSRGRVHWQLHLSLGLSAFARPDKLPPLCTSSRGQLHSYPEPISPPGPIHENLLFGPLTRPDHRATRQLTPHFAMLYLCSRIPYSHYFLLDRTRPSVLHQSDTLLPSSFFYLTVSWFLW